MIKKLLLAIILILVISSTFVIAEEPPKKYDIDVPFGKSIELDFNGFSQATFQVREGAVVSFNVGNLENTFIISEITAKEMKGKLSVMSGPFEDYTLVANLAEDTEIKLSEKIPFILIQYRQFHDSDNIEDKTAIMRIRFPFVTDMNDLTELPVKTKITDNPQLDLPSDDDLTFKILLGVIILLLIIAIVIGPKTLKKRKAKKK